MEDLTIVHLRALEELSTDWKSFSDLKSPWIAFDDLEQLGLAECRRTQLTRSGIDCGTHFEYRTVLRERDLLSLHASVLRS